ncbi:uncharacterized protein LOC128960353 [Oppia nitens]|uniref:uncharacterized protein LOC128960353 n=1 Tax=Oppia nitens TaxID=1686743 RepID=UPI0023D9EEA5|nr:uncharacterized protein LOC128960353 [Oppia nitens]
MDRSFCLIAYIHSNIILLTLFAILSQLLTIQNSFVVSLVTDRDASGVVSTESKNQLIWSSIQWSPYNSSTSQETRNKRDETEDPGRAYGRGVGFFVGEPCESTCNQILFHVFCNLTTHLCECLSDYPVNVDNKICRKAVSLGDNCEASEECSYLVTNAVCGVDAKCQCNQGFNVKSSDKMGTACVAGESPMHLRIGSATYEFINNADVTTLLSLITSLFMLIFLLCFVIKLFNKARFNGADDRCYSRSSAVPPVILTGHLQQTTPSRDSSIINDFPSRRASYTLLAPPPSNLASRRPSMSSIRSQSSLRSYSSYRSQSSYRNNYRPGNGFRESVRRTTSSPIDSMQQIVSNSAFNSQSYRQNHFTPNLRNKSETCIIHDSSGINPSVPNH